MSYANHTTLIPRPTAWALSSIALGLSSVTVVSVGLAMFALIDDARLAALFAAAAILLDVFKYLAWPFAARMLAARRGLCATLLVACALVLAGVSCWATYDRLMASIVGSRAQQEAIQSQRIVDLEASRAGDARLVAALDAEAASARAQAQAMRARGMVSKAAELEASALPRIAAQREQARARLDLQSQELTALRGTPAKGAGLPVELATLLCLGFALALEVVPALILTALRAAPSAAAARVAAPAPVETVGAAPEAVEQAPETLAETLETLAVESAAGPVERGDNAELLQKLLEQTAETVAGETVTLREFAKTHKVGPLRAGIVFRMAVEAGRLAKTSGGRYVVCGNLPFSDCAN
jgi:hypothetical protein